MFIAMNMLKDNDFFEIVMAALRERKAFSTVRMSDGERMILEWTGDANTNPNDVIDSKLFDAGWHSRFGTSGITASAIRERLVLAFTSCTYFCPGAGVQHLFPPHKNPFANKQWTYELSRAQRKALLQEAGKVALINRDLTLIPLFQRNTNAAVQVVMLSRWQQADQVLEACRLACKDVPLFLLSGGPACKYLAPAIAELNKCMVLDVGQGADAWFMPTGAEIGMP